MFSPFEYPEVKITYIELVDKLLKESGRGAVIIGTTFVEGHLTKFIEDILPQKGNKYRKRLLLYPGPLSSFSAKIELAFAFRLIDEKLYDSLNTLREMRNNAAHSSTSFELTELRDKLNKVFDFGPDMPAHVRSQAMKIMMERKLESVNNIFVKYKLTSAEKRDRINKFFEDKELMETLENQIPHWELIFGLSFICGVLSYQKEKTLQVLDENRTWSNL